MASKQIAITDDEMTFANRVAAGMKRADAYRVTFAEAGHMSDKECEDAAAKLCRTKRVSAALKGRKSEMSGAWVADFGSEMAELDLIVAAAMEKESVYFEGGKIAGSEHYSNLGAAVAAIDKKIKIKMAYRCPNARLNRVEKALRMREKNLITDEQMNELVKLALG